MALICKKCGAYFNEGSEELGGANYEYEIPSHWRCPKCGNYKDEAFAEETDKGTDQG